MKIGLVAPTEPVDATAFTWLEELLRTRGHDVVSIDVGSLDDNVDHQLTVIENALSFDASDLDFLISGSAPGWFIRHERHLVYSSSDGLTPPPSDGGQLSIDESPEQLVSMARVALTNASSSEASAVVATLRHHLDATVLSSQRLCRVAAFSEFAALRLEAVGHSEPILVSSPAPPTALGVANTPPRLVVFAQSSFDRDDRLPLLVAAFATIKNTHAELRIAGDGPERPSIEESTADRRVQFLGQVNEQQLRRELLGASSAVVLTVASGWSHIGATAMRAGVPLVVADDAGGIAEIVEHGVNSLVVEPAADRLAWALRHIHSSPRLRWQLGLQAQRRGAELDASTLLDEIEDLATSTHRPCVLTLSTYPVDPMVGGGQRRARFQSRSMAERCNVTVLVNTSPRHRIRRRLIEVGLTQVEVPKSSAQLDAELDMFYVLDKTPVDDITAARLSEASPAFGEELQRQLESADVVVGTQPFLIPTLPTDSPPIVHDSQNVEALLKADLLPDTEGGRWLLGETKRIEADAGRRAAVVTACTEGDAAGLTSPTGSTQTVPTLVVGNGVDASALPYKTAEEHRQARLELLALCDLSVDDDRPIGLFIGSWHPPNISAARLLLELAADRQDWIFILAGSHTSEFADETLPDNVQLIAVFAESLLWPLLAGADVALNPMRSGGGSNLKLFDYLAVGTPIVSTLTGARGLADPDLHCLIAEPSVSDFSTSIDQALSDATTAAGTARAEAGRALVEQAFDWQRLGTTWSAGILDALDIQPGPPRSRHQVVRRPVLSDVKPPSNDPVLAAIQLVGLQARLTPPSPQEVSMDPALRERLKRANDNRNIGRELPPDARFTGPKKALIRIGHALTNEQVIYNEAIVEAVEQMAISMRSLETEQRELRRTVEELHAENRALQRRLEVLE